MEPFGEDGSDGGVPQDAAGGDAGHWSCELLPQQEKTVERLVERGLRVERARDLAAAALAACLKRKTRPADPQAYFTRVVENLFSRYLRDEKGRTVPLVTEPTSAAASPLERVWERELSELVEEALDELPAQQAEVARLHLAGGLTLAAVAREMGLSSSTVRSHWAVARGALQELADRLGLQI